MDNNEHTDHLSWGDSVFLNLEREGMPLNVGSVSLLEGEIPFQACLRFVESKLKLIPRYLKRVVTPPFNIGLPSWDYDPEFDLRNHVRQVTLKHGTDRELKALAGKLFSKVMDRQHPLWDLTLVHGLKGNRTGLIFRMHHCLADGIAGVGIMNVLMDASPVAPALPKKKGRSRVPPRRDALASLLDGWLSSYSNTVERILTAQSEVVNIAERVMAGGGNWPADELARLAPELSAPTQRLRFNVNYRGPQKFTWTEIPIADVKAIRAACDSSFNDVVLALVTSTIRGYAEHHGDSVRKRLLRIMVPVNVRGNGRTGELGNQISLVPVTIPLDIRNPRKLLAAVHKRTEFLKRTHVAELVGLAGTLLGTIATPLQALLGPVASLLPITPFNLVCTNVPGPQFPLYLVGHKMLQWYPYVPVGGEMTVNCAILSYNGTMYFGFSGCSQAVPDLGRMVTLLKSSLRELQEAAGLRSPRKKRRAGKTKKARKTKKQAVSTSEPVTSEPVEAAPATIRIPVALPTAPSRSVSASVESSPIEEEKVPTLSA